VRILCVCLGNICRSPTAEAVLRAMASDRVAVDSAGTSGWHIGDPPYGPAIAAAARRGYDLTPLRARAFGGADFGAFDLILAMDRKNLRDIEALRPEGDATPVRLFLDYAPGTVETEVPDPYYTRDFEGALDLIEAAARGLLSSLGETR
jgi:protein-tyrosine phosphatase